MYDPWVIKWLCSKACESEFDYPWENSCESDDMEKAVIRDKRTQIVYTSFPICIG